MPSSPYLQPALLAVGFAILVAISAAIVIFVNRASDDSQALARTLRLQNALSELLLDVRRAESSQRGYLFTQNPDYLDEFYQAEPAVRQAVAELKQLAAADTSRGAAIDRAEQLIQDKMAELSETIALDQSGHREQARAEVISGRGRDLMTALRAVFDSALQEEQRLAAERTANLRQTSTRLLYLTITGAAFIVLIGGVSVLLVQRSTRQRERARNELAATNANLERIVEHRTADLVEANEEIQRFAYIVSHDLRSPLVNVMGFTSELEALRQDVFAATKRLSAELIAVERLAAAEEADRELERLGGEFDEAISFIKTSIGNMDRLITAVLKLSREGRRQFNPQETDMHGLLLGLQRNVAHRADEIGAAIDVGTLPPVQSDRLALEQIFANLLDNALKYRLQDRPLRVEISGRREGANVIYEVKDNGRGIDPRDHVRVFELFRRSGAQDQPGEGIGLAHVRALVRRIGGNMALTSALGDGSTFKVTLPRYWTMERRQAA